MKDLVKLRGFTTNRSLWRGEMAKWQNGSTSNTTQNREFAWIIGVDIPQNNCKGLYGIL